MIQEGIYVNVLLATIGILAPIFFIIFNQFVALFYIPVSFISLIFGHLFFSELKNGNYRTTMNYLLVYYGLIVTYVAIAIDIVLLIKAF